MKARNIIKGMKKQMEGTWEFKNFKCQSKITNNHTNSLNIPNKRQKLAS